MRHTMSRSTRGFVASLIAAAFAFACGGDGGTTGNDYSIDVSVSPSALTLEQGTSGTVTITLVRGGGFPDAVNASVSGLPIGATGSVSPSQLTGSTTSAIVTVTVGASVTPGTYTVTVTGSATGVGSATATYQLTVTAAPDFTITANPNAVTVQAGSSGATTVSIARTNFSGAVALALTNPPAGITGAFDPVSATGNTSDLTINVAPTVAAGSHQLTITGTGTGAGNRTTTVALTVTAAPDYTLSADPAAVSIQAGTNGVATINIARTNFAGAVTLALSNPPAGVTGSFDPEAPTGNSSILTLTIGPAATPGVYTITIMGTATGVPTRLVGFPAARNANAEIAAAAGDRTTTLQLTVTEPPSITVAAGPATVQSLQGGIAASTVTVTRTNFAAAVNLAASGVPAGMTVTFDPDATVADDWSATVVVGAGVAVGDHAVTVTGSGTGVTDATTTLKVQVQAPLVAFNTEHKFDGPTAPEYFASMNGAGVWQAVLPLYDAGTGVHTFRTNMTAGFGGVAYVLDNTELNATVEALYRSGLIGPEDLNGAFGGRGLIATRLRQAMSVSPTFGNTGKLTIQSFGTPGELNALGSYFAPAATFNSNAVITNGAPRTEIWLGGRHATDDGTMSPVVIPDVSSSRLQYGLVASRFNMSGVLDAVHVKNTAGTANTLDMMGSGSAPPLFTSAFISGPLATTGVFSHLWRNNAFVGLVDQQDPTSTPNKSVGAPQLSQWGPGGLMAITGYDTDELTFKRKFTGFESNWNPKSLPLPALLSATATNSNGYTVNFGAPPEFGLPFRGAAGVVFPTSMTGNAIVGTATSSYFQMSGQSGPDYSLRYFTPAEIGAPASSALGNDNYLLFGVTRSVSCLPDGFTPFPTPNSINTQSIRLMTVGYSPAPRRR